jgi:sporulation protein YlmC with PRC-barrel domain
MGHYKSKDVLGKTVANADGMLIGKLEDIVIDTETWAISDLQVRVEKQTAKELGLKIPLLGFGSLLILIDVSHVKSMSDQVILDMPSEKFKSYVDERAAADAAAAKK